MPTRCRWFWTPVLLLVSPVVPLVSQVTVTVPARSGWFDTGVNVPPGHRLVVTAAGQWSNGGSQPLQVGAQGWPNTGVAGLRAPRLPLGSLIGRIDRRPFFVGTTYSAAVRGGGHLFLSMNDVESDFADNTGSLQVTIDVRPSIAVAVGQYVLPPSVFIPAAQIEALGKIVLTGGRLQLSQTGEGLPRTIAAKSVMSYIAFGPFLEGEGVADFAIDVPQVEYTAEQFVKSGGSITFAQDILSHTLVFIERFRYLVNNIHANFDEDLTIRLGDNEVLLDLRLQAPDPAVRGEGFGYTGVLLIPIPLGWRDGLAPDIAFNSIVATLHLVPAVANGQLTLQPPSVSLTGGLTLSIGVIDGAIEDLKNQLRDGFGESLSAELAKPAVKSPIEKALTTLFLAGKPNKNVKAIKIDSNGVEVQFTQ